MSIVDMMRENGLRWYGLVMRIEKWQSVRVVNERLRKKRKRKTENETVGCG